MEPWKSRRNNALQGTHSVCLHVLHLELFQVHCERLMDPQALRVWLLPSRPLFGFFLMSLHLFGSLDCRLGWCSLCIIMLASWVAPWIAASSESIYRDPMKSVDAPPDSDVAWMRMSRVATTRQNCRQASPAAAECFSRCPLDISMSSAPGCTTFQRQSTWAGCLGMAANPWWHFVQLASMMAEELVASCTLHPIQHTVP